MGGRFRLKNKRWLQNLSLTLLPEFCVDLWCSYWAIAPPRGHIFLCTCIEDCFFAMTTLPGFADIRRSMKKVKRNCSPKSWRLSTSSTHPSGTTFLNLVIKQNASDDISPACSSLSSSDPRCRLSICSQRFHPQYDAEESQYALHPWTGTETSLVSVTSLLTQWIDVVKVVDCPKWIICFL